MYIIFPIQFGILFMHCEMNDITSNSFYSLISYKRIVWNTSYQIIKLALWMFMVICWAKQFRKFVEKVAQCNFLIFEAYKMIHWNILHRNVSYELVCIDINDCSLLLSNHFVRMKFYYSITHEDDVRSPNKGHKRTFTWLQTVMIQTYNRKITSIEHLREKNDNRKK